MNVQGAIVERKLGRAILPRSTPLQHRHGGGRADRRGVIALDLSVTTHLVIHRAPVRGCRRLSVRGSCRTPAPTSRSTRRAVRRTLATWREPRTLLVGVLVLAFAFAEGPASMDQRRGHRRLRRSRERSALASRVPGRDDGRPLVRSGIIDGTAGPGGPDARADLPGRPACSSSSGNTRSPSPGRCSGAWARRSASRSVRAAADDPKRAARGSCGRIDRLLRLPGWPAAGRMPRRPHHVHAD